MLPAKTNIASDYPSNQADDRNAGAASMESSKTCASRFRERLRISKESGIRHNEKFPRERSREQGSGVQFFGIGRGKVPLLPE
jgi:hypothetical protein